jgi:hypothetical protein
LLSSRRLGTHKSISKKGNNSHGETHMHGTGRQQGDIEINRLMSVSRQAGPINGFVGIWYTFMKLDKSNMTAIFLDGMVTGPSNPSIGAIF